MYSAQMTGSEFGSVGSKLKAVGKGLVSAGKKVGKATIKVGSATKGLAVASAMCKLSNANKEQAARAAGVDVNKIHQFCQAAHDKDYVTLAILLPDMLRILDKSPKLKEQSIDAEADLFKKQAKPGLPLWAKIAIGTGGAVVVIGIIAAVTRRPSGPRVVYASRPALAPAPAAAAA